MIESIRLEGELVLNGFEGKRVSIYVESLDETDNSKIGFKNKEE